MKVWIVSQISPFGFGSSANQIMCVYKRKKDAIRQAAESPYLVARPFKVTKKIVKPSEEKID